MAYSFKRTTKIQSPSYLGEIENTTTGSQLVSVSESIADSASLVLTMNIDVSAIKGVMLLSTQDVAFKCNTSDNQISLLAGVPYQWQTGDYFTNLLTTDATSVTVANSSGEAATFDMQIVTDATP